MSTSRSSDALITALRAVRMYETEWSGVEEEGVERSRREGEEERRRKERWGEKRKEGQERRYRTKNEYIKQVNEK